MVWPLTLGGGVVRKSGKFIGVNEINYVSGRAWEAWDSETSSGSTALSWRRVCGGLFGSRALSRRGSFKLATFHSPLFSRQRRRLTPLASGRAFCRAGRLFSGDRGGGLAMVCPWMLGGTGGFHGRVILWSVSIREFLWVHEWLISGTQMVVGIFPSSGSGARRMMCLRS